MDKSANQIGLIDRPKGCTPSTSGQSGGPLLPLISSRSDDSLGFSAVGVSPGQGSLLRSFTLGFGKPSAGLSRLLLLHVCCRDRRHRVFFLRHLFMAGREYQGMFIRQA
jgi:hypothetical protein